MADATWGSSNCLACLAALKGKTIVGVVEDLPIAFAPTNKGNKTLIFDDGTGFTFNSIGAFWHEQRNDVMRALTVVSDQMAAAIDAYNAVLALAGEPGA